MSPRLRRDRWIAVTALCVAITSAGCATKHEASFPYSVEYRCRKATGPVTIDGELDEAAWKQAGVLHFVVPDTLSTPPTRTEARMLYDEERLYLAFHAFDEDIWFAHTKRDEPIYMEDVVEAFFRTDPQAAPYYEFEFSVNEVIWDGLYHGRRGAGGSVRAKTWNSEGTEVAARVQGTVNDWRDRDTSWTCEVSIPLDDLTVPVGRRPRTGDRWRFSLARYDYSVYVRGGSVLSSSAPLRVADFHRLEDYMTLEFE